MEIIPKKHNTKVADMRVGWVCILDTPKIKNVSNEEYEFKKGDLLPSWLYASFPRVLREKYFKRNEKLLSELYAGGAQGKVY